MNFPDHDLIIHGIETESDAVFNTDNYGAFNVSAILRYAIEHGVKTLARLNVDHSLGCLMNCDLDMEQIFRLRRLTDKELSSRTLLIYIDAGDGTHICIDGNHRLAETCHRARARGDEWVDVKSLVVTLAQAERFRVRYFRVSPTGIQTEITSSEMLSIQMGVYTDRDGTIRDTRQAS